MSLELRFSVFLPKALSPNARATQVFGGDSGLRSQQEEYSVVNARPKAQREGGPGSGRYGLIQALLAFLHH